MRNVFGIITHIITNKQEERLLNLIKSIRNFYEEEIFILNNKSPNDKFREKLFDIKNVIILELENRRELGAIYQMYDLVKADSYIFLHDTMLMKEILPDDIFNRNFTPIWYFTPRWIRSVGNGGNEFLCDIVKKYADVGIQEKILEWYTYPEKYKLCGVFGIMFQCKRNFLFECEKLGLKKISENIITRSNAMVAERIIAYYAYNLNYDVKELALQGEIHQQKWYDRNGTYNGKEYFIKYLNGR